MNTEPLKKIMENMILKLSSANHGLCFWLAVKSGNINMNRDTGYV